MERDLLGVPGLWPCKGGLVLKTAVAGSGILGNRRRKEERLKECQSLHGMGDAKVLPWRKGTIAR
ncbi:MAG: hypothetical protein COA70_08615 [Planctomycetota bacterium]|nr:MAG: hypothetical protein COA70_08615 [Planctomycetota bacterium]